MDWKYIFLLVPLAFQTTQAQVDTLAFFSAVRSHYYSVQSTGLKNFSMWVTSDYFRENTGKIIGTNESPLEIIWVNPNKMYFIKRSLPAVADTNDLKSVQNLQLEMQQELKGLVIDWQRFYGGNLLADLPASYQLYNHQDTVFVEYNTLEQGKNMNVCFYFGMNGLCFKLRLYYSESGQQIYIYPVFDYIENKWLCSGWQVQILEQAEVISGFVVDVFSDKIDSCWLPKKIVMQLQTKETADLIFKREYSFSNFMMNRSIQVIE